MRLLQLMTTVIATGLMVATAPRTTMPASKREDIRPLRALHTQPNVTPTLRTLASRIGLHVGTAITAYDLNHSAYRRVAAQQFSVITPANAMKWQVIEPHRGHYHWALADRIVRFAEQHGELVRGHTLLWRKQLPGWLTAGVDNGSISDHELKALLHKHVTNEVTHFRGKIWQWDVANEFFTDSDPSTIRSNGFWVSHLGPSIIADVFRWAHAADPQALLFYNDYNIAGEDSTNAKSNAVYMWLRRMLASGVPIDGVGDQAHLDTRHDFSPRRMTRDLERFAGLGLRVAITEADVRTPVDSPKTQVPINHLAAPAQAYEYSQMLQACLVVRRCVSFSVWGFDDADSWIPGAFPGEGYADIYNIDLKPKPAYYAMRRILQVAIRGAPRRRQSSRPNK